MRICMLVYSFYESDNRVMRYAEALAKRGDQVDIISLKKNTRSFQDVLRGVNVYRIQKREKNEKNHLTYFVRLIRFLIISFLFISWRHIKTPYKLVHVHNMPDFLVFAALLPKLFGAKVILDIHDMVPELYANVFNKKEGSFIFKTLKLIEKASCTFADHVIISNHLWYKLIIERSVSDRKTSVILNYPDESLFFKKRQERQDNKFIIIYPGGLYWRQGVDIAIKSLSIIKNEVPLAELHIYGDGTNRRDFENLSHELGVQDRVIFKGSLPICEVANKMANADLGIEPKRNGHFAGNAMSTKTLEFMSLGVPVIVSDTRVHKHYFNDSVVQFFKSDDEKDLAQCMLLLSRDSDLRLHLRENALNFVYSYKWGKKQEEYLNIVDKIVHNI